MCLRISISSRTPESWHTAFSYQSLPETHEHSGMGCFISKHKIDRGAHAPPLEQPPVSSSPESQLRAYIQSWTPSKQASKLVGDSLAGDSSVVPSLPALGLAKEYGHARSLYSSSLSSLVSKGSQCRGMSTVGFASTHACDRMILAIRLPDYKQTIQGVSCQKRINTA